MLAKWWAFTRWWYLAPNSIIIWHSSGAAAVTRWPPRVSQYTWTPCLFASVSVMFFPPLRTPLPSTSHRSPCLPPPWTPPATATLHHLLPLWSVSLPQDLSSDWDGMFQGYTLPSANEFLKPIYGASPPPPSPLPLSVSPPSLHLLLLGLSPRSLSLLQLESYLFPCLQEWIHALLPPPLHPCSFSSLYLSLSGSTPPPPLHPPSPNATCSHRCVAPIYGFITAAIHSRRRRGRGERR